MDDSVQGHLVEEGVLQFLVRFPPSRITYFLGI